MPSLVIIESPFSAPSEEQFARNQRYLRACIIDSINRGEVPYASHAFFPQVLHDLDTAERELGIDLGFHMMRAFRDAAEHRNDPRGAVQAAYTDLGWSTGMLAGWRFGVSIDIAREERQIGPDWECLLDGRHETVHVAPDPLVLEIKETLQRIPDPARAAQAIRKLVNLT